MIDSANIACGFHAGDPSIMRATVAAAIAHNVEIGAHVSYPDLQGFGRRSMAIRGPELIDLLHYQMAALDGLTRVQGGTVTYIKPHGALYNDMTADTGLLDDVMRAVALWPEPLELMVMGRVDNTPARDLADHHGLTLRFEAFADRAYTDEGTLLSRREPGAVLTATGAAEQAVALANGTLHSCNGIPLSLVADSLCVHGDTPDALAALALIHQRLASA